MLNWFLCSLSVFYFSSHSSVFMRPILLISHFNTKKYFSSVQSLSHVRLFATPWITAHQASLSITNSWYSLRLTSIEAVMPSNHLILCHPLLLLPPIPPSISLFQWVNSSAWGGQSTGVSALASFLPKKFQGWSPSEWTGWISLQRCVFSESLNMWEILPVVFIQQ